MICYIYGDDFMEIFEMLFINIDNDFESVNGKLKKKVKDSVVDKLVEEFEFVNS